MSLGGFQQNVFTNHLYLIYMYKEDLSLDNLQWLVGHKTKPNQTNISYETRLNWKICMTWSFCSNTHDDTPT